MARTLGGGRAWRWLVDGLGRRVSKTFDNSADWDCTYHYYYDASWRRIEMTGGSGHVLKQYVWGTRYVDNPVQIGVNQAPTADPDFDPEDEDHDPAWYYPLQDANFNVTGLVDSAGDLIERYACTPYGQRTVFKNAGSNDETTSGPLYESQRVACGLQPAAWSLCDLGHQGLFLDKELGLYDNRHRVLQPRFGRFMQRDPMGYADGMGLYEYITSNPQNARDPDGLRIMQGPNEEAVEVDLPLLPYTGGGGGGGVGSEYKCPGGKWICVGGTADLMLAKGRQGTLGRCWCTSKAHTADLVFICPSIPVYDRSRGQRADDLTISECNGYEVCRAKQLKRASCGVVVNTRCWGPNATCDLGLSVWHVTGAFDGSQLGGTEYSGSLEATGIWDLVRKGVGTALGGGIKMGPGFEATGTESGPGFTISWGAGAGAAVGAEVRTTVMGCNYGEPSYETLEECMKQAKGTCTRLEPVE